MPKQNGTDQTTIALGNFMSQRLTRARFHGYLRYGSTDEVICTPATVNALVERGWLKPWRATYEITREGKRTEWELVITLGLTLDGFFEFGAIRRFRKGDLTSPASSCSSTRNEFRTFMRSTELQRKAAQENTFGLRYSSRRSCCFRSHVPRRSFVRRRSRSRKEIRALAVI